MQIKTQEQKPLRRRYDRLDWIVLALIGIAAVIRFAELGNIVFYWDEPLHTVRIAAQPLWFAAAYPNGSALFTLMVHFLLGLGSIEVMARLPSAVCGHISVLLIYRLGKTLLSREAGVIAALFMAFSPTLIQYSQYSRMYGTYSFLSLLSLYLFHRALTQGGRGLWIGYSASTAAHIYNHVLGFFALPVYGLFTAGTWLSDLLRPGAQKNPLHPNKRLVKFAVWTLLALLAVALLYMPANTLRNYLLSSINRAAEVSESPASLAALGPILSGQLRPRNSSIFWGLIGLSILGAALSVKNHPREVCLLLLYFFLPFCIFVAIRPNAVTFLSADRYFIIFLPVLFLFLGTALWRGALWTASLAAKKRPAKPSGSGVFIWALAAGLVITLFGLDLKSYYRDYWRLGTYRTPPQVADFLERNLRTENLLLVDGFPASAMTLVAAPLSKDLSLEELELSFRDKRGPETAGDRILLYRIELAALQLYANLDIPVRAALRTNREQQNLLQTSLETNPDIQIKRKGENWTFLHYPSEGTPLFRKIITLVEAQLRLDPPPWRRRQLHWMSARAHLFGGYYNEAIKQAGSARDVTSPGPVPGVVPLPLKFRILDAVFGLNKRELLAAAEERYLVGETAALLFRQANRLAAEGKLEDALRGFSLCAEIFEPLKERSLKRLEDLTVRFFGRRDMEKVIHSFEISQGFRLPNPFNRFLYLEALMRTGQSERARENLKTLYSISPSKEINEKILTDQSAVFLWQEGNRLHLFFRAPKDSAVEGRIRGGKSLRDAKSRWFRLKSADRTKPNQIEFSFRMDGRGVKALEFPHSPRGKIMLDLKIDGRHVPEALVPINFDGKTITGWD